MGLDNTGLPMEAFDFAPRTRIVFGPGVLGKLGAIAASLGGSRVLIVTDRGIVRAGHVDRAEALIAQAGMVSIRFDQTIENPTETAVEHCARFARDQRVDLIVGLGGGSSLDTAKGCNFLLSGGGRMRDYWGIGKARGDLLPLVAVPTTAGTGSECQSFALISHDETHAKMACGDPRAAAAVALLDPELTTTQPERVAACTGIDAMAHALESAVSRKGSPISRMFSREAFFRIASGLRRVFARGDDLEARSDVLLGASLAGLAIENSMLGAAHGAANPLTAHLGVTHGQAVGWMLPAVIRWNGVEPPVVDEYRILARRAGLSANGNPADSLARFVEECLSVGGLADAASVLGDREMDLEALAAEAAGQWTTQFNPREIGPRDFVRLYKAALGSAANTGTEKKDDVVANGNG